MNADLLNAAVSHSHAAGGALGVWPSFPTVLQHMQPQRVATWREIATTSDTSNVSHQSFNLKGEEGG